MAQNLTTACCCIKFCDKNDSALFLQEPSGKRFFLRDLGIDFSPKLCELGNIITCELGNGFSKVRQLGKFFGNWDFVFTGNGKMALAF